MITMKKSAEGTEAGPRSFGATVPGTIPAKDQEQQTRTAGSDPGGQTRHNGSGHTIPGADDPEQVPGMIRTAGREDNEKEGTLDG